jgi:hypothetical protein
MEKVNTHTGAEFAELMSDTLALENFEKTKVKEVKRDPDMEFFVESSFHRGSINQIKRRLGSKCLFIGHLQRPEYVDQKTGERHESPRTAYFLKAVMKNELGGKDTVMFRLGMTPKEMKQDDYIHLLNQLQGDYVTGNES